MTAVVSATARSPASCWTRDASPGPKCRRTTGAQKIRSGSITAPFCSEHAHATRSRRSRSFELDVVDPHDLALIVEQFKRRLVHVARWRHGVNQNTLEMHDLPGTYAGKRLRDRGIPRDGVDVRQVQ